MHHRERRPLESGRWAGAVDTVGTATLPYVLRTLRPGAAVASSGNASGAGLRTTVLPFILRGVSLLGMDSANMAIDERRALWARIATDLRPAGLDDGRLGITEVDLDGLEPALDAILAGRARGRWVVRVGESSVTAARLLAWEIDDTAGFDSAWATLEDGRLRAEGRAVWLRPRPVWIDYRLETGDGFVTRTMDVESRWDGGWASLRLRNDDGAWTVNGERGRTSTARWTATSPRAR